MSVKMVFLTAGLVVAGVVADTGIIGVRVHEKRPDGTNLRLYVPAILVPAAMKFAPDRELNRAAERVKEHLPLLKIAAEELDRIPDSVLVEVNSPREHVSIVKRGGSLVIDVDDSHDTVHVSVPLKMVKSVLSDLEARAKHSSSEFDRQDSFHRDTPLDSGEPK